MESPPKTASVKRELIRVILTASLGVLGFTCVALFIFEVRSYRAETARNLATVTNIIAENSAPALLFDDQKLAGEILSGLRAAPEISTAALFDQQGRLYAVFPEDTPAHQFPATTGADGVVMHATSLTIRQPVMQDNTRVGTIYLEGDLVGTYQRLIAYGGVLLGVGACSLVVALLLSNFLQRQISGPLAALSETAHAVITQKDYSVRAKKMGAREFGELTDALNTMLEEIQTNSAALRDGEERFRTLADNIAQLTWMTERDGSLSWYNKRWFDYTGTTFEEMKGWGWQRVHHPAHVTRVTEKYQRSIASGTDWEDVFPLRGKDGSYRWFLSRAFPIRDDAGEIVRWFGTNTDVTEQRLSHERLETHSKRAEVLSKAATELFLAESSDTIHQVLPAIASTLGAEYFLHYKVEPDGVRLRLDASGGMSVELKTACESVGFNETLCGSCASSGEPLLIVNAQATPSAAAAELRALGIRSYACYPLQSGSRILGTLAFATTTRDEFEPDELHFIRTVSELLSVSLERGRLLNEVREARDMAEKANLAKDNFLAALSHELRTPLNPVLLLASEAANNPELTPAVRDDFAVIAKSVTIESQLIDDLLDLTKITRDKLDLEMRTIDAHTILRDAIRLVENELVGKRLTLKIDLEPGTHLMLGDAVRLQQVFWNVLKNAVKFSPPDGLITVASRAVKTDCLAVRVTDSGIGLTEDELQRVFEAFAQGDHAADRGGHRFGGLGLGLAISRKLVALHGGAISATSEGRGKGATFIIELPLTRAVSSTTLQTDSSIVTVREELPGVRILLVEDHAATRVAIGALLHRRGHQVESAGTVGEARELVRTKRFDLVISDIGLPDETGHILMAELRAEFGLRGIALSGYGAESDLQKSQESGFIAHLIKPVNVKSLDSTLATVLRGS